MQWSVDPRVTDILSIFCQDEEEGESTGSHDEDDMVEESIRDEPKVKRKKGQKNTASDKKRRVDVSPRIRLRRMEDKV